MDINWQELYKEYREENTKTFPLYEGFLKSPKEVFDWFKNRLSEKTVDDVIEWLDETEQPTPAPIREGVESAAQILSKHSEYTEDEILDSERILFGQDEILPAMEEYASQFTAHPGAGSVNTLLAEVLSKYIKYIRDVDGTDYILVHDERYASGVKFTDEQWQLLTDVAKK